jgi:hypothetical protein
MQQLEIEYFFPLTEQIPLDLDYTDCDKPKVYWTTEVLGTGNGIGFTTWSQPHTIAFKPAEDSVGYWELGTGFHFYNKKKPNWLHQKVVALLMGLKWKNK